MSRIMTLTHKILEKWLMLSGQRKQIRKLFTEVQVMLSYVLEWGQPSKPIFPPPASLFPPAHTHRNPVTCTHLPQPSAAPLLSALSPQNSLTILCMFITRIPRFLSSVSSSSDSAHPVTGPIVGWKMTKSGRFNLRIQ